ncbi:MAG TPA: DUF2953 domain-containing protein [Methanoregula sp.]|nr:DUF2953 domain-containing protein [Methanoregula sp.]
MDAFLIPVFIIACTLLIFLFPALILYLVPVRFALHLVQKEGQREYSVTVSWGFFRFRTIHRHDGRRNQVFIGGNVMYSRAGVDEQQKGEDANLPAPADLRSVEGYLNLIPRLIAPMGRFVSVLYHESRLENCTGSIRIGMKDPVATGILYGGYWATRFVLMASRIFIDMTPEFNREVFEIEMELRLRVNHPLRILIAGIHVLTTPGIRQGMIRAKPRSRGASKV